MVVPVISFQDITCKSEQLFIGKCSHKVFTGFIPGSQIKWYIKRCSSKIDAYLEMLAQELFRLIIPDQPQTRVSYDHLDDEYYVLSAEVPQFRPLSKTYALKFLLGNYSGLGQILIGSVFVGEIDLKNDNIGSDPEYKLKKIDGDWCFSAIRYPKMFAGKSDLHVIS